jgi:hypothetical protein
MHFNEIKLFLYIPSVTRLKELKFSNSDAYSIIAIADTSKKDFDDDPRC